jgi:hypothetical protein
MTRKKIGLICAISGSFATVGGAVTGITLVNQGKAQIRSNDDNDKPGNFEKWNIHSKISQQNLQKFINLKVVNNHYIYSINNENFGLKMKNVIRECLTQETRFKSNAENYIIHVNYCFIDTKKVDIEII